jgi:hypothetical protein
MNSRHLSQEQVARFKSKSLNAKDLASVSRHIAGCPDCAAIVGGGQRPPVVPALAAEAEHATCDHLVALIERQASPAVRQWTDDHLRICVRCRTLMQDLRDLEAYLSSPALAVAREQETPNPQSGPSAGRRSSGWLNRALAAALAILLAVWAAGRATNFATSPPAAIERVQVPPISEWGAAIVTGVVILFLLSRRVLRGLGRWGKR